MLKQMVDFFMSFFADPSLSGIALAILFGAIWLFPYWPPVFSKRYAWLWGVMVISAFLTLAAIAFVQIPLQNWTGQALSHIDRDILMRFLLLFAIPQIFLSGFVQEGAKLVPTVLYWLLMRRNIPRLVGLASGVAAGAGFGIFEAQWVNNAVFAAGMPGSIMPFAERFFAVGFHIAAGAAAGYGLAKGKGWQFYLLAACLHGLLNYSAVLQQLGWGIYPVETYVAVVAVAVAVYALWLRWKSASGDTSIDGESDTEVPKD